MKQLTLFNNDPYDGMRYFKIAFNIERQPIVVWTLCPKSLDGWTKATHEEYMTGNIGAS